MNEVFDITTLIAIAVAVFFLLRLRSVLGKRTGHQAPPPSLQRDRQGDQQTDNVVSIGKKHNQARSNKKGEEKSGEAEIYAAIDEYTKSGKTKSNMEKLNKALRKIVDAEADFEPKQFLTGARMAYEMIVTAFADGDRSALKNLLSKEVFDGFAAAIDDREKNGHTVRFTFIGIDKADITQARIEGNDMHLTVEFVSQIISETVDAEAKTVEGDSEQIAEINDIWTFARNVGARNPNWKLVATES